MGLRGKSMAGRGNSKCTGWSRVLEGEAARQKTPEWGGQKGPSHPLSLLGCAEEGLAIWAEADVLSQASAVCFVIGGQGHGWRRAPQGWPHSTREYQRCLIETDLGLEAPAIARPIAVRALALETGPLCFHHLCITAGQACATLGCPSGHQADSTSGSSDQSQIHQASRDPVLFFGPPPLLVELIGKAGADRAHTACLLLRAGAVWALTTTHDPPPASPPYTAV